LTVIAALCPAFNVTGVDIPETLKSFAFTETWESVTLVLPLLVTVTLLEVLVPAFTLAKLTLAGLAESVTAAATPVPASTTAFGEFGALLEMLTLPARLPAVVGAKSTLKVVLAPAAMVAGVFNPLTLYGAPFTEICPTVSEAVPVFVTVKLCDLVCPSTTLPKLNVDGETDRPAWAPVPLKGIVSEELDASLTIVMDPEALPAAAGA